MTTKGLEADLAAMMAGDGASAASEQLGLELFDDMPSPVATALEARKVVQTGPGRPAGSKNRASADLVRLIKATKRPTLLAMKELADLPLTQFAALLGCDLTQAFDRWFKLAELCTAYEEGRPTQRLEVATEVPLIPVLVLGDTPVRPDLVHGNPPMAGEMLNVTDFAVVEEKQEVSEFEPVEVSRPWSHD